MTEPGPTGFAVWTVLGEPADIHVAIPSLGTTLVTTLIISRFRKRRRELEPEVVEALYGGKDA